MISLYKRVVISILFVVVVLCCSGVDSLAANQSMFDKNDWRLLLVNKQHPIPQGYQCELGSLGGDKKCDSRIIEPFNAMMEDANSVGCGITIASPYRDIERQEYLIESKTKGYIEKGYSFLEAYKAAAKKVNVPGTSEHQLGLGIDILSTSHPEMTESFGNTTAGKWLAAHSYEYGFILRYPKDKEKITGTIYEPWHFRYVGIDAATYIYENNLTLEEFWEGL